MTEEPPTKRKCLGADCENDAGDLQCPTCMKLGISGSYFCSQDCFKRNWVSTILFGARNVAHPDPAFAVVVVGSFYDLCR